jgi:2-polyprenyl-6-methoxyphenol hydroxylase-like FAD-dependent oxidoreductase
MEPKIAIIGGGIGGLTAAIALTRKGLAAEVYEQAPVLQEAGAGVGLWPNAMTALESIGLSGKVAQLTVRVARQGLPRPDGTWLMCIPGELMAKRWGAGFILVHRAELQQLLADELDPAVIHLGARCTGVEDSPQAVTARFADGREVQADVLVGADGVHSIVRAALSGPAALRYRGYTAVRSVTPAGSVPLPDGGTETWGRGAASAWAPPAANGSSGMRHGTPRQEGVAQRRHHHADRTEQRHDGPMGRAHYLHRARCPDAGNAPVAAASPA